MKSGIQIENEAEKKTEIRKCGNEKSGKTDKIQTLSKNSLRTLYVHPIQTIMHQSNKNLG